VGYRDYCWLFSRYGYSAYNLVQWGLDFHEAKPYGLEKKIKAKVKKKAPILAGIVYLFNKLCPALHRQSVLCLFLHEVTVAGCEQIKSHSLANADEGLG
jgi:hypothetical protein